MLVCNSADMKVQLISPTGSWTLGRQLLGTRNLIVGPLDASNYTERQTLHLFTDDELGARDEALVRATLAWCDWDGYSGDSPIHVINYDAIIATTEREQTND
jgi:hypothetical protein